MNASANLPATAAPPKTLKPIDEIRNTLMSEETKKQLLMVLPPQMPVERFQRIAITAINKNPDLADCSRLSLYNSFMQCAQDGLLPDGQEAAIVKYRSKDGAPTAQYQPMVKGILKKIRNSGELKSITALCIYKEDPFRYWVDDDGEHLTHEPDLFAADRGPIIGAYALAKTKDDAIYIKVMTKAEIEKVRQSSKAKDSGPWVSWWDQMAEKTAIRRLSKRMPMSTDLEEFLRRDDDLHDPDAVPEKTGAEAEPKAPKGTPGRLQQMLGKPGKVIEGKAREITPQPEPEAPAPEEEAPAPEAPAPEADASGAPSAAEQAEIKRKEVWEAAALKCAQCPAYTFGTNVKAEMDEHMHEEHGGPAPAATKPATTPPKKGAGPGGIFG